MLEARNLTKTYPGGTGPALADVNLKITRGESVAIVGESGSGKSTLARLLLGLDQPSSGEVTFDGAPVPTRGRAFRKSRTHLQLIPQHAAGALNPRLTIQAHFDEILRAHQLPATSARDVTARQLKSVFLDPSYASTYPRRLSGGQQQRVVIARSLLLDPTVLICDEPTSALDALTQSGIVDLLAKRCISPERIFVTITHDLALAARLCARTIVLKGGTLIEDRPTADIITRPEHPYTRSLLDAATI